MCFDRTPKDLWRHAATGPFRHTARARQGRSEVGRVFKTRSEDTSVVEMHLCYAKKLARAILRTGCGRTKQPFLRFAFLPSVLTASFFYWLRGGARHSAPRGRLWENWSNWFVAVQAVGNKCVPEGQWCLRPGWFRLTELHS